MKAVDTNVLIHFHREEMPKHAEAISLIRRLAEGDTPWGIPVFCIGEFLRVVTHHRIFNPPTTLERAVESIDAVLQSPSARVLLPGQRYWNLLQRAIRQAQVTGNLVFDAQIAALCNEHGVDTLISEDRDFTRFEGLNAIPIR